MNIKFYLILGHVLDFYGYVFCEFAFRFSDLLDKHLVWDEKENRYKGAFGYVSEYFWIWSYELGCWFYCKADTLAWKNVPKELYPWKKIEEENENE